MKSACSWKSAHASPPTPSPGWRPISASAALRRWRARSSRVSRHGRTGSSSGPMRPAMPARSAATAAAASRNSTPHGHDTTERPMDLVNVDYSTKIPNNVGLTEDRRVLRALEGWHPGYLSWWQDMGPDGFQDALVYLRTA